jgi:transcriptional regulator with XRE-family HTH domain
MKTKHDSLSPALPADLRDYLETVPPVTAAELAHLQKAGEALDRDPAFQADYLKSRFAERMLEAMLELGETQSDLARRWHRSRQYVSKLFNEDKKVNFTVETLCEVAHLLNRRVDLRVLREDEETHVIRSAPAHRKMEPLASLWAKSISSTRSLPLNDAPVLFGEFRPVTPSLFDHTYELTDSVVK